MTAEHSSTRSKKKSALNSDMPLIHSSSGIASTRRQFLGESAAGVVSICVASTCATMGAQASAKKENQTTPTRPFQIVCHITPVPHTLPILNWLSEGGWCNRISSLPEVTDPMIEEIKTRGWAISVTMWAHPETRARQWKSWNRPVPDADAVVARFKQAFGESFSWELFTEDDSAGVAFPQVLLREQPKTYEQAKALFDAYVAEAMEVANRHRDVERWGRPGYASGAHPLAAQGLDCIMVERANDDVEDLQTGIAFARGAARQFGCTWGVDFSLWWGVINGCVQDLPALYHKRNFHMAFFAGADTVAVEGGDLLYDLQSKKPYLLGQTLDEFGRFTQRVRRGEVDVPVAVVLPEDHGWITPPYWATTRAAWNYARIPYRQGYRGVDAFFAMAYPGSNYAMDPFPFGRYESDNPPASPFALSCVTPEFSPRPENVYNAEPTLPFGRYANRDRAREDLYRRGTETSTYRAMGSTHWGDVIDVVTASVSENVLRQYKVVVLLGPIRLDESMKARLETYVRQGGTLLLAAGVAGPTDSGFCGIEILPEVWTGSAWRWGDEESVHEAFRYCPAKPISGANVQIRARAANGSPLIACREFEQGRVYTCTIPWFEGGTALAGAAARMFDEVIGSVQPVTVEGLPLHWTTSRKDGEVTVALANCNDIEWKGRVCVRSSETHAAICRELLTGETLTAHRDGSQAMCDVTVPPYDVRVLSWVNGDEAS